MTGLPKFVRDQMARTSAPSSHPDADLLSAFAENALTGKERQQVVEHLSACAHCREIAFLAQPEVTDAQTVLTPKAKRFTWMAWASVAAVVVVVASAVLLQHEQVKKVQAPPSVATTTTPAPPESKPAEPGKTSPTSPAVIAEEKKVSPRREFEAQSTKSKPEAEPMIVARDTAADELRAEHAPAPAPAPPSVAGPSTAIGGLTAQGNASGPDQRNMAGMQQQQVLQGPSNSANTANANLAIAESNVAKEESARAAKTFKKQSRDDAFQGIVTGYSPAVAAPRPAARAHWQISPTGALERSYVADNWTPVLAETGVKFHVVSVIGNTVWAGGERGALYVSADGGTTWSPVKIDTSETIASIHFSDASHGTLQTSTGSTLKTADGGRTWVRQ